MKKLFVSILLIASTAFLDAAGFKINDLITSSLAGFGSSGGVTTFFRRVGAITANSADYASVRPPLASYMRYIHGTDNATADTAAMQAAIKSLGTTGGIIRTDGTVSISSSSLTFRRLTGVLRFEIYGSWRLATTLVLPNNVDMVGLGGGTPLQFQRAGPVANIIPPSGAIPTLIIRGSNHHVLENIAIADCHGIGILYDGASALGALADMRNVGVLSADSASATPLQIDAWFWLWIKNCTFLAHRTSPHSIRITTSSAAHSNAGLIHIEDSVIAAHGIQLDAQVAVNDQGNLELHNVIYESGRDALLTLDPTHGVVSGIKLDRVAAADSISMGSIINVTGTSTKEVRNVTIENSDALFPAGKLVDGTGNTNINGLFINMGNNYDYSTGWQFGALQSHYTLLRNGKVNAELPNVASHMSPSVVPYASLNINQEVTTWSGLTGSATVTTGVIAPDGTATAATLTSASGIQSKRVGSVGVSPVSVGDWFIAGVWMRSESSTRPCFDQSAIAPNGSGTVTFDNGTSYYRLWNDATQRLGAPWTPVTVATKVIAQTRSTTFTLLFDLKCDNTHPMSYWKPWAMKIPVRTMSDEEVVRYARTLGNVVGNLPAGSLAMYPDETFYAGRVVAQKTTTFTDGAATPDVSAGNLFKTANSSSTTITDFSNGVDGQKIVVLGDANTTIQNGSKIKTRSSSNISGAANVTNTFIRISGVWYQVN